MTEYFLHDRVTGDTLHVIGGLAVKVQRISNLKFYTVLGEVDDPEVCEIVRECFEPVPVNEVEHE